MILVLLTDAHQCPSNPNICWHVLVCYQHVPSQILAMSRLASTWFNSKIYQRQIKLGCEGALWLWRVEWHSPAAAAAGAVEKGGGSASFSRLAFYWESEQVKSAPRKPQPHMKPGAPPRYCEKA